MQKKIHLLFRIRSMEIGGVQKVLLEYLKNIPQNIFDISLIINLHQGELLNEIPQNIKVYSIGKGKENLSKNPWIKTFQLIIRRGILYFYKMFPTFLYQKLSTKPDIEIAFETSVFSDVINSPIENSKKIAWLHNDLVNTNSDENINLQIISLMKKFDICIFVSEFAKNNLKKHYNIDFSKAYVINNPINPKEIQEKSSTFKPILSSPCFVAAGRLTKSKGCLTLLSVHQKLIENGFHHYIYILGDGPEKQNLIQKIKKLSVENTFILLGNQNNPYPYFKESNYFIHPSHRESYPMVILENLLLNKPIISTNVGGIPEMIDDGIDGVLVNYNEEEIFQAMKKFLTNPEFVEKIKQGTYRADQKFDEQKIYQQVTEIFLSVLETKNK